MKGEVLRIRANYPHTTWLHPGGEVVLLYILIAIMQFTSLSTSYGTSIPRDQFIIQSLSPLSASDNGAEPDDEREEQQLRARELPRKRENSNGRAPTLDSFISEEDEELSPAEEDRNEEPVDDESSVALQDDMGREIAIEVNSLTLSTTMPHQDTARRKNVSTLRKFISLPSLNSPNDMTPLLATRRSSMATLTPRSLQKTMQGPDAGPSRKVYFTRNIF